MSGTTQLLLTFGLLQNIIYVKKTSINVCERPPKPLNRFIDREEMCISFPVGLCQLFVIRCSAAAVVNFKHIS